jgi:hypothetical protein
MSKDGCSKRKSLSVDLVYLADKFVGLLATRMQSAHSPFPGVHSDNLMRYQN